MLEIFNVVAFAIPTALALATEAGAQGYAPTDPTTQIFGWMKALVALVTFGGLAFGGWNMVIQMKFKKIDDHDTRIANLSDALKSAEGAHAALKTELEGARREGLALHRRLDEFDRRYSDDRVSLVEKFATKSEINVIEGKLAEALKEVRDSIDKLRTKLEEKKA